MNIKIFFSDLDGTLVEHAGEITRETVDAAKKLMEEGIDIVLVSGRHPDMMKSIHSDMGLKTPVIGCNGSIIKDLKTKEVLYIQEVSETIIKKTIRIARELQIDWVVYEKNNIFFESMPPKSYKLPYKNAALPAHLQANFVHISSEAQLFIPEHAFLKVLLLFDQNMEAMEQAKILLAEMDGVNVLRSATTYLDVMANGTSKGNGVNMYLNWVKLDKSYAAAIGDAQNDKDMLEFVSLGIAMGNAVESVKEVAQLVVGHYPEGFKEAAAYLIQANDRP